MLQDSIGKLAKSIYIGYNINSSRIDKQSSKWYILEMSTLSSRMEIHGQESIFHTVHSL